MSCHPTLSSKKKKGQRRVNQLTFVLAGNANVGKSVLFNQLTGSNQIIGNWPGKTVERAEGTFSFETYQIHLIDLPGIYSLSTFSLEELVSRDYIAFEKPDVVINVIDASVLERNLFFTLQLLEMEVPLIICLNQVDIAKKKGITIDTDKLELMLGVPVIPTVAVKGVGKEKLIKRAIEVAQSKREIQKNQMKFSDELEAKIGKLTLLIESKNLGLQHVSRWIAIKLLENDLEIKKLFASKSEEIIQESEISVAEIFSRYNEQSFSIIASERYSIANKIASNVQTLITTNKTFSEKLDWLTTHKIFGYFVTAGILIGLLLWTFIIGDLLSGLISDALSFIEPVDPEISGPLISILWNGVFGGIVAGVTLIIPFVIPFYLLLTLIEDSGILTRIAFMMDSAMHKIGLHGKAIIPLILGYGCNVPAIYGCRIMETRRERILAALAITFVPCAARTIIILGLVAAFVGLEWALALYAIDILIIFLLGRLAFKITPGKSTGLIMEIHSFKIPSLSVVARQTWIRTKSIIFMVFPIYIIGSAIVQTMYAFGILEPVANATAFLTVEWLGLPAIAGILLIFGTIRKEFILLMLVAIYGSTNLLLFLTPVQLLVLALIAILYIPCISTILALAKELGWKVAIKITLTNIVAALIIGGLFFRLLSLIF